MSLDEKRHQVLDCFDLSGRVAIVTGASRGIGRAISAGFASLGAKVVMGTRLPEEGEQAAAEIRSTGATALACPLNIADLEQIDVLVAATVDSFGGVDIVVNNAADPLTEPLGELTAAGWQMSIDANLRGPVFLVQSALPHLRASEHAAVVNVISAAVFTQAPDVSMYVAAKAGLLSMTRSMAASFAVDGIRVNALAPGATDTDMVRALEPEMREAMVAGQLIARLADPGELVGPALFLASDASSFMTGQVLVVDGGLTVT